MKGLYMFVGGLNVYSLFALFFWETRRSDFKVMIVHHIVTSSLIILSYVFRYVLPMYIKDFFTFSDLSRDF